MTDYKCPACGATNGINKDTSMCPWCDHPISADLSLKSEWHRQMVAKTGDPHLDQLMTYRRIMDESLAEKQNMATQPTITSMFVMCPGCNSFMASEEYLKHKCEGDKE